MNDKLHTAGKHTKGILSEVGGFFTEPLTIGALIMTGIGVFVWSQQAKKNIDMDKDLEEIDENDKGDDAVTSLANRIKTHAKSHSGAWIAAIGMSVLVGAAFFHFYVYERHKHHGGHEIKAPKHHGHEMKAPSHDMADRHM